MKLTIGMACYDDLDGVYFTIQALRLMHDLSDVEIVVVDANPTGKMGKLLANWVPGWANCRYFGIENIGSAHSKNVVFEKATGDFVLCIDSHVLIPAYGIARLLELIEQEPETCENLVHGVMLYDDLKTPVTHMDPVWRGEMFGTWGYDPSVVQSIALSEIPMHGMGLFGTMRKTWLKFNAEFKGFGGEEGYIHEKYRQHGRKVLCAPWLKWVHRFLRVQTGYSNDLKDRVFNYMLGWLELGLPVQDVYAAFTPRLSPGLLDQLYAEAINHA